jgi:hypothetical protein
VGSNRFAAVAFIENPIYGQTAAKEMVANLEVDVCCYHLQVPLLAALGRM